MQLGQNKVSGKRMDQSGKVRQKKPRFLANIRLGSSEMGVQKMGMRRS